MERLGKDQNTAKQIVRNYIDLQRSIESQPRQVYSLEVVWFSKTLGNWKAFIRTTLSDDMCYELNHNGDTQETFLDVFIKVDNITVGPLGDRLGRRRSDWV